MRFDGWNDELCHYGIKGQKWGIRRYQNPDGTLTEQGKAKYRQQRSNYYAIKQVARRASREKGYTVGKLIFNGPETLGKYAEKIGKAGKDYYNAQRDYYAANNLYNSHKTSENEKALRKAFNKLHKENEKFSPIMQEMAKKSAQDFLGDFGNKSIYDSRVYRYRNGNRTRKIKRTAEEIVADALKSLAFYYRDN